MSKVIKFQKLVTGAMELNTHMQRHCNKAHDRNYVFIPFHVTSGGRRWAAVVEEVLNQAKMSHKLMAKADFLTFQRCSTTEQVRESFWVVEKMMEFQARSDNGLACNSKWQFLMVPP